MCRVNGKAGGDHGSVLTSDGVATYAPWLHTRRTPARSAFAAGAGPARASNSGCPGAASPSRPPCAGAARWLNTGPAHPRRQCRRWAAAARPAVLHAGGGDRGTARSRGRSGRSVPPTAPAPPAAPAPPPLIASRAHRAPSACGVAQLATRSGAGSRASLAGLLGREPAG
eukprot:scaffold1527_cov101-Isochrysis_galbana.AAC.5